MSNTAPEAGSIARIESSSPLFSPLEISFPHAPGVYRDQADERADTPIVTENPCKLQHTPDLDDFLVANASRDSDFPMVSRDSLEANIEVDTDDNTDFDAYADVDLDDIAFVNASGEPATSLSAKECPGGSAKQSKRSAKRERARLRRRNNGSSKKPPVPTQAPRSAPAQAPSQAPARDLPQALEEATRVALQSTRASAQYHQLPSKPPPVVNSALVRDASSQSTKAGNGSRATPPVTGTPTYTARRTSSSFRRRQESLDSPVTVPPKPLVRNSISALASAAVASAFTPVRPREHSPAASPSPAAVSSTSSATTLEAVPRTTPPPPSTPPIAKKALVNSTPEKLTPQEKRAAAKPRANGQEVSNVDKDGDTMTGTTDDSDKEEIGTPRRKTPEKTPPKSPQKKTTPLKGRPVVKPKPRITSPDKGHLNDDDTITDSSEAGVVPSARRTATTSPRPIKKSATLHSAAHAKKPTSLEKSKKARRLSSDSLEGAPERPRKRVSFGGVSYHEPEFQPAGTAVTTGIPSLRPASTLTVSGPVAPAKTLVPAPVNIPPGARLFPIYPGGRSRSRDVTPENAPAKSTAITKTIPPAALQDARQTINQGTVQDTALKEDVLPPGSLFRAAETSNTPGAQETVLEASGSLFITKAADSRECEIANLLLSMKKQINENMVELKRLMEPESEDFMVSCHLEMVEAQLQVLSLATYATWHKITSNKRGNENFQD
ncbi:hypothetical protein SBRCBS47491_002247 [Sporothrix bragantina]|uniref:Uncharacterized protein n=1 Tax=Sporothrix bragantina TaxID=671064 RepID=A0ABP0B5F1_9PEZI